jgi:hypothetical protein
VLATNAPVFLERPPAFRGLNFPVRYRAIHPQAGWEFLYTRSDASRDAYNGGFDAGVGASVARLERMIRKLKSGKYRLYSRKIDPRTNRRRNLGTFDTREAAEKHERAVQYFKRHS